MGMGVWTMLMGEFSGRLSSWREEEEGGVTTGIDCFVVNLSTHFGTKKPTKNK